ncbi:Lrp/AsnC family transcriptional regulator [Maritimibacter sp. 55A14]|uniref:Lrp/AsnC family transcriptional regulator n=1 Tax=Maritimibacter sp. 55A14 TaxID=2174844 RepID=UPI001E58E4AC|nr:Lrp/AsnC family transcriptional regulator [Maritimibacter sp. 55A14]
MKEYRSQKKVNEAPRLRTEASNLDPIDAAIIRELRADARIARAELARRVGLSAPSVGERVRRLEDTGVITGYAARIDPARLGYGLTVLIRARPLPGEMGNMIAAIRETPQIVMCERVSGDDCFVARAHVRDVAEMEAVIDRLVPFGATNSSVVQSMPVPPRLVELRNQTTRRGLG